MVCIPKGETMFYQASGTRCAVHFESLNLPLSTAESVRLLESLGFTLLEVDLPGLARSQIGRAQWRRKALPKEAPHVVNCSTFIKWLYAELGIWLPRRAIQQREFGMPVSRGQLAQGDIVFIEGRHPCYYHDPNDGVGHVGIMAQEHTVIHAGGPNKSVCEVSLDEFLSYGNWRGARRYTYEKEPVHTFSVPSSQHVEWSDDIRWIILENIPS